MNKNIQLQCLSRIEVDDSALKERREWNLRMGFNTLLPTMDSEEQYVIHPRGCRPPDFR